MKAIVEGIVRFLKLLFSMFTKDATDSKLQEQKDRLRDKIKKINEEQDNVKEQVQESVSEYKETIAKVDQIKDQTEAKLDDQKDPFDKWNER